MSKKLKDKDFKIEGQANLLGFKSVMEYHNWCLSHGFSTKANKTQREFSTERELIRQQKANEYLLKSKQINFKRMLKDYLKGFKNQEDKTPFPNGYDVFADLKDIYHNSENPEFKEQVFRFAQQLINADLNEKVNNQYRLVEVLRNIVRYHPNWVRSPDLWRIKSHNTYRQFSSILRNLFCLYEMPDFMDKIWLQPNPRDISWYFHMGKGLNIRTAEDLPIPFTKKMAHHFCKAPSSYQINEAIRYGQVLSIGGNARLADCLRETRLCREFGTPNSETFWESVIRWFSVQAMFDYTNVGPIIDYVHNQRFVPTTEIVDGIAERRPPLEPNLTMNGRNPETLLRQVHEWHAQLNRARRGARYNAYQRQYADLKWAKSTIRDFEFTEGQDKNKKTWRIQELLTSEELQDEGRQMSHCVSSYAYSCHEGRSTIWSMNKQDRLGRTRELTIEVSMADRKIVQIRGKMNKMPNDQQLIVINRWAQQARLSISGHY